MKKFITVPILLLVKVIFRLMDELVPKNDKLVLFASKSGKLPNANVLEIWLELKKRDSYFPYLVTRSKNDSSHLNLFTWKGLWLILRSKYVFLTHGPGDVIYAWYGRRKVVTYVGHGVPLKSFFFTNKSTTFLESFFQKLEVPGYDYILATSEADQKSLMKCFNKKASQVLVTGLPRNDLVTNAPQRLADYFSGYSGYILYAPTHRDKEKSAFFPFEDIDLFSLNNFLREKNYILVLRGHVNNKGEGIDVSNLSHIKTLNIDTLSEIQFVLGDFDLLVTDYSSMYIDYLLTEKPLLFIPYDLSDYQKTRGMLYDYHKVSPGPHVETQKQFISSVDKLLSDRSYYHQERLNVKKMFHKDLSGFSERVLEEVIFKAEKK